MKIFSVNYLILHSASATFLSLICPLASIYKNNCQSKYFSWGLDLKQGRCYASYTV